jgi:hypothetical protein
MVNRYKKSNAKKAKQLGMPIGTAHARLRKSILFQLVEECAKNVCFRCNNPIETVAELSVDHKENWLGANTALFWNLDNVTFSHLSCNIKAARRSHKKVGPEGTSWCCECKEYLPLKEFYRGSLKTSSTRNGVKPYCKRHATLAMRRYRARKALRK